MAALSYFLCMVVLTLFSTFCSSVSFILCRLRNENPIPCMNFPVRTESKDHPASEHVSMHVQLLNRKIDNVLDPLPSVTSILPQELLPKTENTVFEKKYTTAKILTELDQYLDGTKSNLIIENHSTSTEFSMKNDHVAQMNDNVSVQFSSSKFIKFGKIQDRTEGNVSHRNIPVLNISKNLTMPEKLLPDLSQTSCSFEWVENINENRIPEIVKETRCKNILKCAHVQYPFLFLQKINDSRDTPVYHPEWKTISVACILREISKLEPNVLTLSTNA
ncbi:uncharacterized protein LOC129227319 [Uloborus diversus]|uniref:uncharacterized protein LOC129227319 n=1 Tax=Uloborus diversus TaxID=327109 RepID=UPI002409539A|nr:uncharacterized protein LOC129227319 [Uloborus diversus]